MPLLKLGLRSADALGTRKSASLADAAAEARVLLRADFARNPFPMQRITLTIWRAGQSLCGRPGLGAWLARRFVQVLDGIWIRGLLGSELPTQVVCGPGVRIPHSARGVIIHPTCVIGANAVIYHHVTIGMLDTLPGPRIEDNVFVGVGARVLGTITVAEGTRIGANAVVVKDTLAYHTYGGVPAKVIRGYDRTIYG